jgi:alpha-amylase/alpha-mannosidase (GH57 family)
LVRLLSITETFAADLLSREVDRAVANGQSITAIKVADEAVIRATSGWQDQQRSYKDWLGVKVDWKAVERLAEARNAVTHGLGN